MGESFNQTLFEIMDYKGEIQGACAAWLPPFSSYSWPIDNHDG
jgi:hypothetical protein